MAYSPSDRKTQSGREIYKNFDIQGTDLEHHQKVIVRQKAGCCDLKCCGDWAVCPRTREYHITDSNGKELLVCEARRPCFSSCCGVCHRETHIRVLSRKEEKVVARMTRAGQCCGFCHILKCCRPNLSVTEGDGSNPLGRVNSDFQLCCTCLPSFSVHDHKDWEVFTVRKEMQCLKRLCCYCCCPSCCPRKEHFLIKNLDKDRVGSIVKKAELRSTYSDADTYLINFPAEATAAHRLVLIGASLLIDYSLFHEDTPTNSESQRMVD